MDSTTIRMMAFASDSMARVRAARVDSVRAAADAAAQWILARHDLVLLSMAVVPSIALVVSVWIWRTKNVGL